MPGHGGWSGRRVRQETHAVLVAEHGNQYDPNAVSVWVSGHKVGHLGREDAARLRPGLLMLQRRFGQPIALAGQIVGGGSNEGRKGMLGVFLNYDSAEFGIQSEVTHSVGNPSPASLRTGLSHAVATDEADDTYDLAWLSIMLEEYDAACREHDSEMDRIVSALVEKFGVVPLLATYRQAATRHQKAKDLAQALWWAERGIVLYQDNPAKSEMLLDLYKRAGTYRAKLDRTAGGT